MVFINKGERTMAINVKQVIITCEDTGKHYFAIFEDYNDAPQNDEEAREIYNRWYNTISAEARSHGVTFWKAEGAEGEYWSSEM